MSSSSFSPSPVSSTTSTSTPTPPSSSEASIPKIWRNGSLERAGRNIPTISDQHVVVVEDPAAHRRHPPNLHRAPVRPPSPYPRHAEPEEREAAEHTAEQPELVLESALYPEYHGYEQRDFIRVVDGWVCNLETLHADYKEEFHRQCNWYMRGKLCAYRKLLRRMERIVQRLRELLALLLRTAALRSSAESRIPGECSWLQLTLDAWIKRAAKRFELLTMKNATEYIFPRERRRVMVSMEGDVEVLATGLKVGPLERVAEIVEIVACSSAVLQ